MYGKFLMTFEDHKIMPVAFVVAEKKVLAMDGIDVFPIFKGQLDRRKRGMGMKFIAETVLLKEVQDLGYAWIICHLLRLLA